MKHIPTHYALSAVAAVAFLSFGGGMFLGIEEGKAQERADAIQEELMISRGECVTDSQCYRVCIASLRPDEDEALCDNLLDPADEQDEVLPANHSRHWEVYLARR